MRTRNEIEVGKITPQQFQIYCIKALNIIFSHNKELKDLEKLGYDIYIDLIHHNCFLLI